MNQYYKELSGLRGIAVLLVILNHTNPTFLAGGYIGVDVFFVLSGFLITRLIINDLEAGEFKFKDFYIRRIRRIYPALLCVIIITLLLGFLLYSPTLLEDLAESSIYSVFSLSNFYFWFDSDYFSPIRQFKPLLHTWSLSVEEQFYLFAPLIIFGLFINRWIFRAIVLLAFLSLVFSQLLFYRDISASFYLMPSRAFEFAIGALAIPVISYLQGVRRQLVGLVEVGLGMIFSSGVLFSEEILFPGVYALIPTLGTFLIIVGVSVGSRFSVGSFLLTSKLLDNIGKLSYSLYLIHWPVLVYGQYWLWEFRNLRLVEFLIYFTACLILAFLMYQFVEKRWRIRRGDVTSDIMSIRRILLSKVAVFTLFITFVSFLTVYTSGVPERLMFSQVTFQKDIREKLSTLSVSKSIDGFRGRSSFGVGKTNVDILMLGDSHADMYEHALIEVSQHKNLRVEKWATPSCPALFGVRAIFTKLGLTGSPKYQKLCNDYSVLWEEYINEQNTPPVVWLSSRWQTYYEHEKHGDIWPDQNYLLGFGNEKRLDPVVSKEVFEKAIRYTVKVLTDAGKKVILIAQVPNIGMHSLFHCLDTPRYLFKENGVNDRCHPVTKSNILSRSKFTDDVFKTVASEFDNVTAIIPTEYFCPSESEKCVFFDENGISLWRDDDHLSITGSMMVLKHYSDTLFKE